MPVSSAGTDVYYGDVILHNWLTNQFDQSPVLDSSGTDTMYDKFVISGECILSPVLTAQVAQRLGIEIDGLSGGAFPITTIADALQRKLNQQRQNFRMYMNGAQLLAVDSCAEISSGLLVSGISDVNNGPRVNAKVTHISPATLHVQATFELAKVVCDSPRVRYVLSNRWQFADDIDEQFKINRRIQGTVRLSQEIWNPQMFRGMVVPPLLKGWKRVRMHFTTDRTGLELGYEINDRQMIGPAPPDPAMKMTATHLQSFHAESLKVMETLNVRLDGGRFSDKKLMAQWCVQIAANKLRYNALSPNAKHITAFVLADHFGDDVNAIECHVEVWRTDPTAANQSAGPLDLSLFGAPLSLPAPYDINKSINQGPYPDPADAVGMLACYLQTPCNDGFHNMAETNPIGPQMGNPTGHSESAATQITYNVGAGVPPLIPYPSLSAGHLQNAYQFGRIENIYVRTENRAHLPIARFFGQSAGDDTAVVVRLAGPTCRRIVKVAFERVGKSPMLWKPIDFTDGFGIKHWLLKFTPNLRSVQPTGDGRELNSIDAEYVYGLSRPPLESEGFSYSTLPWYAPNTQYGSAQPPGKYDVTSFIEPSESAANSGLA